MFVLWYVVVSDSKASFYLKIPKKNESGGDHLPDQCATMMAGAIQQPLNPHRQKLLAASKRAPKVEKGDPKAKAKAKAKGKAKAKPSPTVPKVSAAEMKAKAKRDYAAAKDSFFESFLDKPFLE